MKFLKYFLLLILMVAPSMAGALSRSKPTPDQRAAIQARRKAIQDARAERDHAKAVRDDAIEELRDAQADLRDAEGYYQEEEGEYLGELSDAGLSKGEMSALADLDRQIEALNKRIKALRVQQDALLDEMGLIDDREIGPLAADIENECQKRSQPYLDKITELEGAQYDDEFDEGEGF